MKTKLDKMTVPTTKMVNGVVISPNGTIGDIQVPAKTADVLEWIRKKYKNIEIQFQGKIQDSIKDSQWLSIFAATNGDEEHTNQHMLPSPFDEETYSGPIVILATESEEQDQYDPSVSSYINLKADHYETVYQEWTFADEEEEADIVENDNEDEDVVVEDDDDEEDDEVPNERKSDHATQADDCDKFETNRQVKET